jgi:hypothetical protein
VRAEFRKRRVAVIEQAVAEQQVLTHRRIGRPAAGGRSTVVPRRLEFAPQRSPVAVLHVEAARGFGDIAQAHQRHVEGARGAEVSVEQGVFEVMRALGTGHRTVPQQADAGGKQPRARGVRNRNFGDKISVALERLHLHCRLRVGRQYEGDAACGHEIAP